MNGWYWTGRVLTWTLAKLLFNFRVIHPERIPLSGGLIVASNHQSYLDPPLIGVCSKRDICFLARKTLFQWPILGPIFPKLGVVPVDQERADMSALKTIVRLVEAGKATGVFPEGARTLDGKLQPVQPGLGLVIAKTGAPVVPVRIFGAFEAFPRGAKRIKRHPVTIVVGNPIHFTKEELTGHGRDLYQKLSERVMNEIAAITL